MLDEVSEKHYRNPVSGFTKLFSSLIFSTVWREEMHVKVVWITMLAMANRNGDVLASVPGLADAARVSLEQCQEALTKLSSPDEWSRTKEHEGRRIVEVDGGWRLLNYPKYRELRDADERRIQTRENVRAYRERKKANPLTVSAVSRRKPGKAQAEAEADADAEGKSKALVALKRDDDATPDHPEPKSKSNGGYPKRGAVSVAVIIAGLQDVEVATARRQTKEAFRQMMVEIVFSYWAKRLGHERALLDGTRRQLLAKRFVENGDNLSELLYVVDGALRDDWTMGRDPKSRRAYDDVETIFRDRAQVERFAATVPGYKQGTAHPMAEKYGAPA